MREIDVKTWSRRQHFELYSALASPHFSVCAHVDLTRFRPFVKEHALSFNLAIIYAIARSANSIPEFRCRIQQGRPVVYDVIHPTSTIMGEQDVFGFCLMEYADSFPDFAENASRQVATTRAHPRLDIVEPGRDDLFYMTAVPWLSFTSFMHPTPLQPADSVPRFAWGKFFEQGRSIKMPLSVQGHHALMDGLHVAQFYERIQAYLDVPESLLADGQG